MSTDNIIAGPFRLAFPEVFTPKAGVEGGKEKFSINMLFPKDCSPLIPSMPSEGINALRKLALAAIKQTWGEDKSKWPANFKNLDPKTATDVKGFPVRDGDLVSWDGFAGNLFARASSQFQPGLVNSKLQPIISQSEVYGGLICRAQVNAYTYDVSGNRGVSFGLTNLQVLKDDGISFGAGKADAASAFTAYSESPASTSDESWG